MVYEPSVEFFIIKVNGVPKYATYSLDAAYDAVRTMPQGEIFRFNITGPEVKSLDDDGVSYGNPFIDDEDENEGGMI